MTTETDAMPEPALDARPNLPATYSKTRPYYWSVRRELWEYRSIVIAPLAAAGVVLFGFLISTFYLSRTVRVISGLPPAKQHSVLSAPYGIAAFAVVATAAIVAVFYCLGALHNERRDRSILFWKSLPVSDLTTVLAKASIPFFVLPLVVFPVIVATQLIMRGVSIPILALHGLSTTPLATQVPLFRMSVELLYVLIVLSLWYAPIWAWLLLVSGWSRRMAFLWAILPPLALCLIEKIAFDTAFLASMLADRLTGGLDKAVDGTTQGQIDLAQLDPAKFVSSPDLWAGLTVAAALLAAAIWLRRYRDPI
jgi:ABC-2 type transport system permease protein